MFTEEKLQDTAKQKEKQSYLKNVLYGVLVIF